MILAAFLAAALTTDQKAVMVPVDALFAALAAHDGQAVLPLVRPEGGATVATEKADGTRIVRHLGWDQFAAGLKPTTDTFQETMPNPIIRVDGDIAMVWGHYTFSINGTVHHCGVDHFELIRENATWKIANISWSSRTTGCGK